jgi:hypothetical protein
MKLISIHPSCGHTSVMVQKSNIEYCVEVNNWDDSKKSIYENFTGRKIRTDSKLYKTMCDFVHNKMAEEITA